MFNNFLTFISATANSWIQTEIVNIFTQISSTIAAIVAGIVGIVSLQRVIKMIIIGVKISKATKDGESTNGAKEDLKKLGIGLGVMVIGATMAGLISGLASTLIV